MDLKRYCEQVSLNDPPMIEVPVVYLPYSKKCYKKKVIDRRLLSHDQHTALLATPRGFNWDKTTGVATPPKIVLEEDTNEYVNNLVRTLDQRYVRNFTTDFWNVMTPKYRRKLEKILMKEFKLSKRAAKEFIKEQKLRSAFKQKNIESRVNLSERHDWVKEMADVVADKLTAYVEEMLSARRTPLVQARAEVILEAFAELTGEQCEIDKPNNKIQSMQVLASDRLAVWLSRVVGDYDQELCYNKLKLVKIDSDTSEEDIPPTPDPPDKDKKSEESKPKSKLSKSKPKKTKPKEPKPEEPKPEKPKPEKPKPGKSKLEELKLEEPELEEPKPEEPEPKEPMPEDFSAYNASS